MTDDPHTPDPPFTYACVDCGERIEFDEHDPEKELLTCPACGERLVNVSTPSGE
ncbi:MAG: hypothetical protein ABEI80_05440 [Haloplanus sp.]